MLLATPLSTRSILAGKWWGAFRQSRHLLIWPAVTAGLILTASGRVFAYIGLLGLISAYAAAITSVGLALATWVSRLGRAVALCVAAYVVFSIGWLILILVSVMGHGGESGQSSRRARRHGEPSVWGGLRHDGRRARVTSRAG